MHNLTADGNGCCTGRTVKLTDDEKRLFLGENARRFYQFGALPELPYIKNMSE